MNLFALDASGKSCSVAIIKDKDIIFESVLNVGLTHSGTLLVQVDNAFTGTMLTPNDIDFYAVTVGPGSFTGLRIGIATIKGLAFMGKARCIEVSTLEALSYGVTIPDTVIVPVIDARRNRVYTTIYNQKGSGELIKIAEDSIVDIEDLPNMLSDIKEKIIFVGDAANICYEYTKDKILSLVTPMVDGYIKGGAVAKVALKKLKSDETVSAAELIPVYMQLSQAERERIKETERYDSTNQ